ncbi:hypothetical protein CLLI_18340 [Clostridium liquoris]|jgi:hypothetical protein|uniref:Uncharacterized protein n=1 Tax=Clostridium liquoris TaxID=1289519 RepID=A0A2T0B2Y1_9CLOT|nr:hypothetical protein CLLI_18340 [Clostridium liquoris]
MESGPCGGRTNFKNLILKAEEYLIEDSSSFYIIKAF